MNQATLIAAFSGPPAGTAWGICAPVALGGVALFLLLPRPRPYPPLLGAACAALALLLAGCLLVHTGTSGAETILFYSFSGIAIVSGGLLTTQANPVRAALSFALVVLSTCGLFLLLAAPFLMAATTIVYAGAIIVTFLFVIMLAQQSGLSDADQRSREPLLTTVGGFVLLGALLFVLAVTYDTTELDRHLRRTNAVINELNGARSDADWHGRGAAEAETTLKEFLDWQNRNAGPGTEAGKRLEDSLVAALSIVANPQTGRVETVRALTVVSANAENVRGTMGFVRPDPSVPLSDGSGPPPNLPIAEVRRDPLGRPPLPAENVAYLGRSLFSDYLLAVELAGTLLLVATIGAIAIARRYLASSDSPGVVDGRAR